MLKNAILSAALVAALPIAASAATYTYDVDFTFSGLREAGLGVHADPRPGRGGFSGSLSIDGSMNILSFDIMSTNTTTSYASETSYTYSSGDTDDSSSVAGPIAGRPGIRNTLSFYDADSYVAAGENRTVPTGAFRAGWRYYVPGAYLQIFVSSGFTPGDDELTISAREVFGVANAVSPPGFKTDLGYEHITSGFFSAGELRVGGTGSGVGGTSPVPLPAGGLLLLTGLVGIAGLKRPNRSAA